MFTADYPEINKLITQLSDAFQDALGQSLNGLYLFGSLVGGDFDPKTSDIDLLAIVESVISKVQLKDLQRVHQAFVEQHPEWDNRIEVAYVPADGMRHFKTKTSKIARISPGEALHYRDMDIDWLMDWHMVQEQGQTIFGPPPETYIPHITSEEYVRSIRNILPEFEASAQKAGHKGYQSYIVLSFCRNLYAIKHGKQVSKIAGARWAAEQYPQWTEFINEAVKWRGMADKSNSPESKKQTIEFATFAMSESRKS